MRFQIKEKRIRFGGYIYTITRKKMAFATAAGLCICVIIGSIINYNAKKRLLQHFLFRRLLSFQKLQNHPSHPYLQAAKRPIFSSISQVL